MYSILYYEKQDFTLICSLLTKCLRSTYSNPKLYICLTDLFKVTVSRDFSALFVKNLYIIRSFMKMLKRFSNIFRVLKVIRLLSSKFMCPEVENYAHTECHRYQYTAQAQILYFASLTL